jgi:protein gp37
MGQANYSSVINDEGKWNNKVVCLGRKVLDKPLHWRKPRRIFVCSMSDLFHKKVPREFIAKVLDVACKAYIDRGHILQFLTKRPKRMRDEFAVWSHLRGNDMLGLEGFHIGVTCENLDNLWRIAELRKIPAAVKFISFEPLLGLIPNINFEGIDWGIVGGESGPKARPMHPDWVRNIRDQFVAANKPFFFKQWGEWIPSDHYQDCDWEPSRTQRIPKTKKHIMGDNTTKSGMMMYRVGKKDAGNLLDGKAWEQFPADLQIQERL